jgi:hypothetical protein
MSEDTLAAPVEEPNPIEDGQEPIPTEDPAPSPEDTPAKPDAVQAKINKLVGQKHEERRARETADARVVELEAQLKTQTPAKTGGAPKLEDYDYDDAKYQDALIDYKVNQKTQEFQQQQEQQAVQTNRNAAQTKFNAKVVELNEPDYAEVVGQIPTLPAETLDVLIGSENPKLVYYLGKHLDIADEISRMSPTVAAMRLGQISAQLSNANPTKEPSAAPDPIDPINSGGTPSAKRGPPGARYE